ncbi:hypothetical protein SAMN04487944_11630 [Gracilibacillus ureilyticus]|uniref:Uncharacterized protein n=1 Tax=Gracilibacillus ureilyticus TaxID=531814 RepID=A0A1H9U593_9BACI|nr:tetratricopeptide repeat protein [Gracilibacillus ureilyticus]SES04720.1 hypothetical protein SAMN04487944_11630 [Gracilibacillus ureilyticus]
MEQVLAPNKKLSELEKKRKDAIKAKDKAKTEHYRSELVKFYVQYGSVLKTDVKNDREALKYLERALRYEENHALANYRYAHIMYKQGEFVMALSHFQKAIDSHVEPLNDTLMQITYLYMADASLKVAREALDNSETSEGIGSLDEAKIQKLREKLSIPDFFQLEKAWFRKLTGTEEELIDTVQYDLLCEETIHNPNLVILANKDTEIHLIYQGITSEPLENSTYRVLYFVLKSREFIDNKTICEKINLSIETEETNESGIRTAFTRIREKIPFWEHILEQRKNGRRTEHRLRDGMKVVFVTEAGEILPDDV